MPGFEVVRISATPLPQTSIYLALHNDYSEEFVTSTSMSEEKCGQIAVERLLKGNRGHYGPLEHAHMLMAIRADHNTIMQLRTHRLFSFDVQCVAGDTKVTLVSAKGIAAKPVAIRDLYAAWALDPAKVGTKRVRSLDEASNRYVTNSVAQVFSSGPKETIKLSLQDGKHLQCTREHRILTVKGWAEAGDLVPGDKVMVNGRATACHKREHALSAHPVAITQIEPAGVTDTYDIAMKAPHHNFVANGIVVHNSMRYTGDRVIQVAEGSVPVDDVFSLRPPGTYLDRDGKRYIYAGFDIEEDRQACFAAAMEYANRRAAGRPEEDARRVLPTCYFQNAYVSGNLRSWLHLLDVRLKKDAQLEIREVADRAAIHIMEWAPQVTEWWQNTRAGKALLAP
jgi:thymidylate synthase (FAD)